AAGFGSSIVLTVRVMGLGLAKVRYTGTLTVVTSPTVTAWRSVASPRTMAGTRLSSTMVTVAALLAGMLAALTTPVICTWKVSLGATVVLPAMVMLAVACCDPAGMTTLPVVN